MLLPGQLTLLIVALCLQWVLSSRSIVVDNTEDDLSADVDQSFAESKPEHSTYGAHPATFIVLAVALGALGAANAWDVPLYAVMVAAAGVTAVGVPFRINSIGSWSRLAKNLAIAVLVFAFAYVLYLPFHRSFEALFTQVERVRAGTDPSEFGLHLAGLLTLVALGIIALGIRHQPIRNTAHDLRFERFLSITTMLVAVVVSAGLVFFLDQQPVDLWFVLLPLAYPERNDRISLLGLLSSEPLRRFSSQQYSCCPSLWLPCLAGPFWRSRLPSGSPVFSSGSPQMMEPNDFSVC